MTTEVKIKWCSKFWDEIKISSNRVPHVGLQIVVEASRGTYTEQHVGYTFSEAIDKLFESTLELATAREHYVD